MFLEVSLLWLATHGVPARHMPKFESGRMGWANWKVQAQEAINPSIRVALRI